MQWDLSHLGGRLRFAINHMAAPGLRYDAVLRLARTLGCVGVEFRNDLPGALFDGDSPEQARAVARKLGVDILGLSEITAFNDMSAERMQNAQELIVTAKRLGARAIGLIPRNDGQRCDPGARKADLRAALRALSPHLRAAGIQGWIEPLGFDTASLRHKAEIVEAIAAIGGEDRFKLVHDTFHHALAQETEFFGPQTGIVHLSGVTDSARPLAGLRDVDRGLVTAQDRLGTLAQIEALMGAGYGGAFAFEPFAPELARAADPAPGLRRSFDYIENAVTVRAA